MEEREQSMFLTGTGNVIYQFAGVAEWQKAIIQQKFSNNYLDKSKIK